MPRPKPPRFLITRLSALGDCIVTLPMVCALREAFPDSRIVWLAQKENAPLLKAHFDIDDVIVVHRRWFRRPVDIARLRQRLRQEEFTAVFDPQSLSKSSAAGWLSGCTERIGLARPLGREIAPNFNTKLISVKEETHVVDRFLALLRPLGIDDPQVEFRIPINAESTLMVDQFIKENCLETGYAVLNPGAGWPSKRWSNIRYGEVARHLNNLWGIRSVISWYGATELAWAQDIVGHSGGAALLADPTNLFGLAALLKQSSLFIGSDSGPMHLSVAVGTPCVALHGTTRPEISGPHGSGHRPLQMYYHSGSSRVRRNANNDAMLAISVGHVVDACNDILSQQNMPPVQHARLRSAD